MNASIAIQRVINSALENVHTCLPGTIDKYDYTVQRAEVKPQIKKQFNNGTIKSMPEIVSVPVMFPRSSDAMLHFPLKRGDRVLLLFSERAISSWLAKGVETTPEDSRKFDLTDAIAIPGLYPFTDNTLAENNKDLILIHKGTKLIIDGSGKVTIGNGSQELLDLLDQVITALIASTTATAIGAQPLSKTINGTFLAIKVKLGLLKG